MVSLDVTCYPKARFYDDNLTGWGNAQEKNGDTVKATLAGALRRTGLSVGINSVNRYAYVKVSEMSPEVTSWSFAVWKGGVQKGIWEFSSAGEKEIDVYSTYVGEVDEIRVGVGGYSGAYIIVDWVVLGCKQKIGNVENDLLGLQIDLQSGRGLNGAVLKLDTSDVSYAPELQDVFRIVVENEKLFTGLVAERRDTWTKTHRFVEAKLVDLGFELLTMPIVKQRFRDKTVKQMITSLLGNAVFVSTYGVDPDDELSDTYDLMLDNVTVFDALKKICGLEDVEWYVDCKGNLWVYPKNKYTSGITVNAANTLRCERTYDFMALRNKIKVLGARLATVPSDGDSWTETSTSGWGGDFDTYSLDDSTYKVGSYSLKAYEDSTATAERLWFQPSENVSALFSDEPSSLEFWLRVDYTTKPAELRIGLYDGNGNAALQRLSIPESGTWAFYKLPLGPNERAWWGLNIDVFDWTDIDEIRWSFTGVQPVEELTVRVDGLCFSGKPLQKEQSSSTSISDYGERNLLQAEDSLSDQNAVDSYAARLLAARKGPQGEILLETLGAAFQPGYKQSVSLSEIGLTGTYRIARVTHTITKQWTSRLVLSKPAPSRFTVYVSQVDRDARKTRIPKFVL